MDIMSMLKQALLLSLVFLVACSGDDEIVGTGGGPQIVEAAAHKGPFIIGSKVTINRLSATGIATEKTIVTEIRNDLGGFSFELEKAGLIQIKVDGYHFNEIRGVVSNGRLDLNAVYDTNNNDEIFINILTHLISNRVLQLISTGSGYDPAVTQAQGELQAALSGIFTLDDNTDFGRLSVFNLAGTNSLGNAYLLALSALFYKYADIQVEGSNNLPSAYLSETLNTLASDLSDDGKLSNQDLINALIATISKLNPDEIMNNLIQQSIKVNGTALAVPDINLIIDTDGDGLNNSVDSDDDNDNIVDELDPYPYTPNLVPTANAGADIFDVLSGATVSLDGSLSIDADGQDLSYNWTQLSGEVITFIDPSLSKPSFIAPAVAGDIVVSLVVSDGFVESAASLVTISVVNESISMSLGGATPAQFNELVDSTYPSGYRTKLSVAYNETKIVKGLLRAATTITLENNEVDGSVSTLIINVFNTGLGVFVVDTEARLRYFSMSGEIRNSNYRASTGTVTISERGDVGGAVRGSYNVNAVCTGTYRDCQATDTISISGAFLIKRDSDQLFTSVGSLSAPLDLGPLPVIDNMGYVYTGQNINMVSAATPSYYQISVQAFSNYKIELTSPSSGIKLAVYDTASFTSPICETSTALSTLVSCSVASTGNTLYFSVQTINPSVLGAWYGIAINFATTRDEGTLGAPIDISSLSPFQGQVGTIGSYYQFSVTPGTMQHVSIETYFGISTIEVYETSLFQNNICTTINNGCNVSVGANTSMLYVKIPPSSYATDTYYYYINHWEITATLYTLELFQTISTTDYSFCTNLQMYDAAGDSLVGLHVINGACSNISANATVALESGKTYYLQLPDASQHFLNPVDYYAVWIGLGKFSGTLQAITPDPTLNEPANDTLLGATAIETNAIYYDSFKSTDDDTDWFKITVP